MSTEGTENIVRELVAHVTDARRGRADGHGAGYQDVAGQKGPLRCAHLDFKRLDEPARRLRIGDIAAHRRSRGWRLQAGMTL